MCYIYYTFVYELYIIQPRPTRPAAACHMKIHVYPHIGNYSLFKELNIIVDVKFS